MVATVLVTRHYTGSQQVISYLTLIYYNTCGADSNIKKYNPKGKFGIMTH